MSGRRTQVVDARRRHPASRVPPTGRGPKPPVGRRSGLFVVLFTTVVVLSLLGLAMVLSASSVAALEEGYSAWHVFRRQAIWLAVGLTAFVVGIRTDYHVWRRMAMPAWIVSVVLLVLVLVPGVGVRVNGAARWLAVGPFQIQPSELAKFTTALVVADLLARPSRPIHDLRVTLKPTLVLTGVVAVLLVAEPDLDTAIIVGTVAFAILFAAGTDLKVVGGLVVAATAITTVASLSAGYRRQRLMVMRDPWSDPLNTGYQTLQSLVSVANGGVTGIGVGASRGKWGYLPFAHSDFLFAVIAEELGFVGATIVVGLFAMVGVLGLMIALRASDLFGRLLVVGVVAWIVLQAFLHIGGVLGVIPATGVTLPFMSSGGTALVMSLFGMGIVCNVARQTR